MDYFEKYDYHLLRLPFRSYIRMKFPNRTEKSIKTIVDDAMALFSWMPEKEAWDFISDMHRDVESQRTFLEDEFLSHRQNPRRDANGYLRALTQFRGFLLILDEIECARKHLPRKIVVKE